MTFLMQNEANDKKKMLENVLYYHVQSQVTSRIRDLFQWIWRVFLGHKGFYSVRVQ